MLFILDVMSRGHRLRSFLNAWPGKKSFGMYRFLPVFFILGAAVEFAMIKWTVGETNFCK